MSLYNQSRYILQENFNFIKKIKKIAVSRPEEELFVNKTAIKTEFGMVLEKFGISQNCWEKSWEFLGFRWEFPRFGSSHTD